MSHSTTNQKTFNAIIADDHPLILMGLEQALSKLKYIEIKEKCKDGLEAYNAITNHNADIAILDIQMPELNGLEIAERLKHEKSATKIVLLTMFHDLSFLEKARQLDVNGYLLKDSMLDEIDTCLTSIINGKDYLSTSMEAIQSEIEKKLSSLDQLTRMEKKVFHLIGEKKSSKEIASMLFVSPKTIDNHRYNICKKLEITGGTNALLKYASEFKN